MKDNPESYPLTKPLVNAAPRAWVGMLARWARLRQYRWTCLSFIPESPATEPTVAVSVADAVWRITTPLPGRPREVHAYLVQLAEGWMLVDGGIGTPEAWAALDAGVRALAGSWASVTLQVVTHMHMDHVGLAGRARAASGAPVAMGALDAERMRSAAADPGDEAAYRAALLTAAGAPREVREVFEAQRAAAAGMAPPVQVDVQLAGAEGVLPGAPGWGWLWTPGHTAGHVSLIRPADGVVIAGDAVMEGITPTLGVNRQRASPVGDYLEALDRLDAANPSLILAGHGPPAAAERIDALRRATLEEADAVAGLVGADPVTAWEVSTARYTGRVLPPAMQMLALRETRAHLDRLSGAGVVRMETRHGVDWFVRGAAS